MPRTHNMKHIKYILATRRAELLASRYVHAQEKGSNEWAAFNTIRDDRVEMFPSDPIRVRKVPVVHYRDSTLPQHTLSLFPR